MTQKEKRKLQYVTTYSNKRNAEKALADFKKAGWKNLIVVKARGNNYVIYKVLRSIKIQKTKKKQQRKKRQNIKQKAGPLSLGHLFTERDKNWM